MMTKEAWNQRNNQRKGMIGESLVLQVFASLGAVKKPKEQRRGDLLIPATGQAIEVKTSWGPSFNFNQIKHLLLQPSDILAFVGISETDVHVAHCLFSEAQSDILYQPEESTLVQRLRMVGFQHFQKEAAKTSKLANQGRYEYQKPEDYKYLTVYRWDLTEGEI